MIDLSRALVNYLRSDSILSSKLGKFRGHASIFATQPIPESAKTPFVVTHSISDVTLETKNGVVREILQDIGVYEKDDGGSADVEEICEYIREKLRTPFDVPDWNMSSWSMSGPVLNDSDDFNGRILTARITLDR